MIGEKKKAEIIEIIPDFVKESKFGHKKHYPGHVITLDQDGAQHCHINCSINQIKRQHHIVGLKGVEKFEKGPNGTTLWFFYPNE